MASPVRALLECAACLIGGELPCRLLELGERLKLGVERGGGGAETDKLAHKRGGFGGRGDRARGGGGAAGEVVGEDVVEGRLLTLFFDTCQRG